MDNKERTPRLTVYLPENIKNQLLIMSEETGMAQSQLVVMATQAMLAQYDKSGQAMFRKLFCFADND